MSLFGLRDLNNGPTFGKKRPRLVRRHREVVVAVKVGNVVDIRKRHGLLPVVAQFQRKLIV